MAFKTFTAGSVLTASDVMTYLMNQVVIVCTSGTRPGSPSEGMTIFETDTDKYLSYSGSAWIELGKVGAWTTWTHGWNGTISNGTINARYNRLFGRVIAFNLTLTWGSSTSAPASQWTFNLPVAAQSIFSAAATVIDNSANTRWVGSIDGLAGAAANGINRVLVESEGSSAGTNSAALNSNTVPFTWATSDRLQIAGVYEANAD